MTEFIQTLVSGSSVGALYSLMAVGIVLIYRSTRTINFAQGMMATAGAFLYAILVVDRGMNAGVAFVLLVVAGAVGGLLTYGAVGRPLVTASPLARTIATILWMLVTQAALLLVLDNTQRPIPALFSQESMEVAGVAVSRQSVGVIVLTALSVAGLYAFFRRSKYGLAVRAVAEKRDAARVIGIPLLRVDALAWVLGGATAFCGGALVAPFSIGDFTQLNLLLVKVLAAAAVGAFVSLPLALAAGVGLGLGEQLLQVYAPSQGEVREMLPFLMVMAVITAQSFGWIRTQAEGSTGTDRQVSTVRQGVSERFAPTARVATFVLVAAGAIAPQIIGTTWSFVLGRGLIFGIVVLSLVAVTGFSGQVSLAQASFMGLGAYFGHYFIAKIGIIGFWTAVPLVAVVGALVAGALSVSALRVRGLQLAVVTWTFGLLVDRVVLRWDWLVSAGSGGLLGDAGSGGASLARPSLFGIDLRQDTRFVYLLLGMALLAAFVVRNYSHSRSGLAVRVQRDDEDAAVVSGLVVWRLRLYSFMLSGALASVGGFLVLVHQGTVIPSEFNQFLALTFMLILVLGGTESWIGALTAGVFFAFAPDLFERLPALTGDWQFLVLGLAGIGIIAVTEGGWGAVLRGRLRASAIPNGTRPGRPIGRMADEAGSARPQTPGATSRSPRSSGIADKGPHLPARRVTGDLPARSRRRYASVYEERPMPRYPISDQNGRTPSAERSTR